METRLCCPVSYTCLLWRRGCAALFPTLACYGDEAVLPCFLHWLVMETRLCCPVSYTCLLWRRGCTALHLLCKRESRITPANSFPPIFPTNASVPVSYPVSLLTTTCGFCLGLSRVDGFWMSFSSPCCLHCDSVIQTRVSLGLCLGITLCGHFGVWLGSGR